MFGRYHYLTHNLNSSSKQYVGFINDKPVAFVSYINMPHPKGAIKRINRMITLPDYQGLGITMKMLEMVAKNIDPKYPRVHLVTSHKVVGKSLMKNKSWRLIRVGKVSLNKNLKTLNKTSSTNRNTYSFCYVGKRTGK